MQRQYFNLERISSFCSQSPDLAIFSAPNADEYIFLLFEIERSMEQEGKTKLPAHQVTSIIREFYSKTDLAQVEMKTSSVLRNYIDNYQVFRDFYEGRERYITFTSLGRELLGLVTERISDSPRLSGLSIEQFFNDISALAQYNPSESREQKIKKAKDGLKELSERIALAEEGDEEALAELGTQMMPEEYLVDAERQQQYTLLAGEDVKKAIKDTRSEILQSTMSVGRNIKVYSEFNEALKLKPAYKSYVRATDLVSHIDALSAKNPYRNVSRALRQIQNSRIIPEDRLQKSPLWNFNQQFDRLKNEIAEEENTNIRLLAAQVRVTTSFDGKKLTEDLKELVQALVKNPEPALQYFNESAIEYTGTDSLAATEFKMNSFSISEKVRVTAPREDMVSEEDRRLIAQQLAEAEEKTFKTVMQNLKSVIGSKKSLRVSDLTFKAGLMEFVFVYFAPDLDEAILEEYVHVDPWSYQVSDKKGRFLITNLRDKRLFMKEDGLNGN